MARFFGPFSFCAFSQLLVFTEFSKRAGFPLFGNTCLVIYSSGTLGASQRINYVIYLMHRRSCHLCHLNLREVVFSVHRRTGRSRF